MALREGKLLSVNVCFWFPQLKEDQDCDREAEEFLFCEEEEGGGEDALDNARSVALEEAGRTFLMEDHLQDFCHFLALILLVLCLKLENESASERERPRKKNKQTNTNL